MNPPAISQERAESLLGPYLPAFGGCLLKAEEDWLHEFRAEIRKDCTDTLKARWYWERAHLHARAVFADVPEARLFRLGGIPFISIRDEAWMRFKKGTGNRGTVGYPTEQRLTLSSRGQFDWIAPEWEQITLPWGGVRPVLVCGYVLDAFGRTKELFVAHPAGDGSRNLYDFPISMADAIAFPMPNVAPEAPAVASNLPSVRLKAE